MSFLPPIVCRSSSVSLPHLLRTLPSSSRHLPDTVSQFMTILLARASAPAHGSDSCRHHAMRAEMGVPCTPLGRALGRCACGRSAAWLSWGALDAGAEPRKETAMARAADYRGERAKMVERQIAQRGISD